MKTPVSAECKICGITFTKKANYQLYCSKPCESKSRSIKRNGWPVEKPCGLCGSPFSTNDPRKIFCSRRCYRENDRLRSLITPLRINCASCGVIFDSKWGKKTCSKICKERAWESASLPNKKCEECGVEFFTKNKNTCCSRKCSAKNIRKRHDVQKECQICGVAFKVPSIRRYQSTCSKDCRKLEDMTFSVLTCRFKLSRADIPKSIFDAKLKQLILHRELKKQQKTKPTV